MAKAKSKLKALYRVEVRWVKGTKRDDLPGWWEVRYAEPGRGAFTNKLNAVRFARQVAKIHQPSTLVIFDKKQQNQAEYTYPRSRDPRRSKG